MSDSLQRKDWRDLCVAVIKEQDSNKLRSLIQELVEALDRARESGAIPLRRSEQSTCGSRKVVMTACGRA
jgi:hypothetical protein